MANGHGGHRDGSGPKKGSRWSPEARQRSAERSARRRLDRAAARAAAPEAGALVPAEPRRGMSPRKLLEAAMTIVRARRAQHLRSLNPFQVPAFPPGAIPPEGNKDLPRLAMDRRLALDWGGQQLDQAITAGFGGLLGAEGVMFLGYSYLAELAQRSEYRQIAETIADDATRKWIDFEVVGEKDRDAKAGKEDRTFEDLDPERRQDKLKSSGKLDKVKKIKDRLDEMQLRDAMYAVCRDDGFFGRSHLHLKFHEDDDPARSEELKTDVGDGRNALSKMKVDQQHPLRGVKVVEPMWVYPLVYNANDPLRDDWYKPVQWYVMGSQIHISRMLPFVGHPVPDILKPAYAFGGVSLSQLAKPYVDIWLQTRDSVGRLIQSFSVMVLKTDLQTILQPGGGYQDLVDRLDAFNLIRDNNGIFALNKDTEDFANVSVSLSGLHELQAQSQEHMMSVVRIPDVKFTGINPTGLNACLTGDTLIETDQGCLPIRDVRVGQRVMTRKGWAPVAKAGCTGYATELIEIEAEGSIIRCTADHRIWLPAISAFVPAANVRRGDFLLCRGEIGSRGTAHQSHIGDNFGRTEGMATMPPQSRTKGNTCYTERFGAFTTGLFRKVTTFITSTEIAETISLAISKLSELRTMPSCMVSPSGSSPTSQLNMSANVAIAAIGSSYRNRRELSFAATGAGSPSDEEAESRRPGRVRPAFALRAGSLLRPSEETRNFVPGGARPRARTVHPTWLSTTKRIATDGLNTANAERLAVVSSVRRIPAQEFVFDIQVASGHLPEFFANGACVHNSSEGVMRAYYDTIGAYQNRFMRPGLTKVVWFTQLSLFGEVDPEITFEFEPLREMSEKERADLQKAQADRDQVYVDMGAFSPAEVRKVAIEDPSLPFVDLDPDDVPELRQEEQQGLVPEGAGKGLEAVLGEPGGQQPPEGGAPSGGAPPPAPGPKGAPPPASGRGGGAEQDPAFETAEDADEPVARSGLPWGHQYEWSRGYDLPTRRAKDEAPVVRQAAGEAARRGLQVGSRVRYDDNGGGTGRVFGFVRNDGADDDVAILDHDRDRALFVPLARVASRPVALDAMPPSLASGGVFGADAEFIESEHPRDGDGKFAEGEQGSAAAPDESPSGVPAGGLTKAEEKAIFAYQGGGSDILNAFVAGRDWRSEYVPSHIGSIKNVPKMARALAEALSRSSLAEDTKVYRGFSDTKGAFADDSMIGKTFIPGSFFSTSRDPREAKERGVISWMRDNPDQSAPDYEQRAEREAWTMEMGAPRGTNALDFNASLPRPSFAEEKEVLFGPDVIVRIDAIDRASRAVKASVVGKRMKPARDSALDAALEHDDVPRYRAGSWPEAVDEMFAGDADWDESRHERAPDGRFGAVAGEHRHHDRPLIRSSGGGWKPRPLHPTKMRRVGPQMGSNPGGVFEDDEGSRYYVKKGQTPDHVRNELQAADFYDLAGAPTLRYVPVAGGGHVATRMTKLDKDRADKLDEGEVHRARQDFATHAWTANYDAVGTGGDNLVTIKGVPTAIDLGGALEYRARGKPKGTDPSSASGSFGDKVPELDTMRDPEIAPDASKVFGGITPAEFRESALRVTSIPDEEIRESVRARGSPPALAERMIARRDDIARRARTWGSHGDPAKATSAVVFAAGDEPPVKELNGVKFEEWKPPADWNDVEGQIDLGEEPLPEHLPSHKQLASGLVIREPDGRVWLTRPSEMSGGYAHTYPKGRVEPGLSLQANAIKEAWEETGLKARITGLLGDAEGDATHTRYYLAEREGGDPSRPGEESDGVALVPPGELDGFLNRRRDREIAEHFGQDSAFDASWEEGKHPRGQPENKGQFGPGGGGAQQKSAGTQRQQASAQPSSRTYLGNVPSTHQEHLAQRQEQQPSAQQRRIEEGHQRRAEEVLAAKRRRSEASRKFGEHVARKLEGLDAEQKKRQDKHAEATREFFAGADVKKSTAARARTFLTRHAAGAAEHHLTAVMLMPVIHHTVESAVTMAGMSAIPGLGIAATAVAAYSVHQLMHHFHLTLGGGLELLRDAVHGALDVARGLGETSQKIAALETEAGFGGLDAAPSSVREALEALAAAIDELGSDEELLAGDEAPFDESKHPRDAKGEFATKGNEGASGAGQTSIYKQDTFKDFANEMDVAISGQHYATAAHLIMSNSGFAEQLNSVTPKYVAEKVIPNLPDWEGKPDWLKQGAKEPHVGVGNKFLDEVTKLNEDIDGKGDVQSAEKKIALAQKYGIKPDHGLLVGSLSDDELAALESKYGSSATETPIQKAYNQVPGYMNLSLKPYAQGAGAEQPQKKTKFGGLWKVTGNGEGADIYANAMSVLGKPAFAGSSYRSMLAYLIKSAPEGSLPAPAVGDLKQKLVEALYMAQAKASTLGKADDVKKLGAALGYIAGADPKAFDAGFKAFEASGGKGAAPAPKSEPPKLSTMADLEKQVPDFAAAVKQVDEQHKVSSKASASKKVKAAVQSGATLDALEVALKPGEKKKLEHDWNVTAKKQGKPALQVAFEKYKEWYPFSPEKPASQQLAEGLAEAAASKASGDPTEAELAKAKKSAALQMEYVPGAPETDVGKQLAQQHVDDFNAKYAGKDLSAAAALKQKVADFKAMVEKVGKVTAEEQKHKSEWAAEQKKKAQQAAKEAAAAAAKAAAEVKKTNQLYMSELGISEAEAEGFAGLVEMVAGAAHQKELIKEFQGHAKAARDFLGASSSMTGFEAALIENYKSGSSVNAELRKPAASWGASQWAYSKVLNSALSKLPPYKGAVIRNADLTAEIAGRYQAGNVVLETGFTSTSDRRGGVFSGNTRFYITGIGRRGASIKNAFGFQGEGEVLFQARTAFHVDKVQGTPGGHGKYKVWMTEVET